jgi:hypothetical protein
VEKKGWASIYSKSGLSLKSFFKIMVIKSRESSQKIPGGNYNSSSCVALKIKYSEPPLNGQSPHII